MPGSQQQAERLIQQAGLEDVLHHVQHAVQMMAASTVQLRAHERASALSLDAGDMARTAAIADLQAAVRATTQAAALVREQRASPGQAQFLQRFEAVRGRAQGSLDDGRARFRMGLQRADISAADAQEISALWDEMAGHVTGSGLDDLYIQLENRLAEFGNQVTVDNNFGQSPHSPLATWQWILIGVLIGIGAAAVIACLIWGGCSWIAAIFVGIFCIGGTAANPTIAALCAGFTF